VHATPKAFAQSASKSAQHLQKLAQQGGGEYSYKKGNISPEAMARANQFRDNPLFLGTDNPDDFELNPYWAKKMGSYYEGRNIDLDSLRVGLDDLGTSTPGRTSNVTGRITIGSMGGWYGVNAEGNIEGSPAMLEAFLHESMRHIAFNDAGMLGTLPRAMVENWYPESTRDDTSALQGLSYKDVTMWDPRFLQDQLAQRFAEDVYSRMGFR